MTCAEHGQATPPGGGPAGWRVHGQRRGVTGYSQRLSVVTSFTKSEPGQVTPRPTWATRQPVVGRITAALIASQGVICTGEEATARSNV